MLPLDPFDDVIEQVSEGRLVQGRGWGQTAADQRGPHLAHAVPVPGPPVQRAGLEGQQAVERALQQSLKLSLA